MRRKKLLLMAFLIPAVLSAVLFWHLRNHVVVGLRLYPENAQQLDLRDRDLTVRQYEKLMVHMPECEIFWKVPFQNGAISSDTEVLTISRLDEKDIQSLKYFPDLREIHGENCKDYGAMLTLLQHRPDLRVCYNVPLGGRKYPVETEQVTLEQITAEEIELLDYLPNLKNVLCSGGDTETITQLKAYCQNGQLGFQISIGGEVISPNEQEITVTAITASQMDLLQFLPKLKHLHIRRPQLSAQNLLELQQKFPGATITWEQELYGQQFSSDQEILDLSGLFISGLEELEQKISYFPEVKQVFLGECGLDNDLLAAHREKVRDQYKLVWTVSCGDKLKTRTDATTFMPVREHVYYFNDEEAYNLRYCEDMICIDIGHMSVHNIDFVAFMPNLEYLILAHTQVQSIEPISTCKKLKFLELDWSPVKDLSPLKGCTALEDLNLGKVYGDFTAVGEMTWLKNLWMVECSPADRYRMFEALPDTRVMRSGEATVANGWRKLDNYYKMRDLLGMYYMSW